MTTQTKMLLQGKLKLSPERLENLMAHAIKRRNSIRTQAGFMDGGHPNTQNNRGQYVGWRGANYTGWAQIRAEASAMYEGDFTHRAYPGNKHRYPSIFQQFNDSLNLPARAVNVFGAKAREALVNTSPFTGFMPEGDDDNADAIKLAERYFHEALDSGDARHHFGEGIRQACISEAVMKITLKPVGGEPETKEDAQIWLDAGGNPKRDLRGGYIFTDEELVTSPDVFGAKVLKRDPSVQFDGSEIESEPMTMVRDTPTENKLDIAPVGWENFFCSVTEANIHDADCIFHEFDEDFDVLMGRAQASGVRLSREAKEWLESLKNSRQAGAGSEGAQPVASRGERDYEMDGPVKVHICEMWMRFDVMGRNKPDEICFVWAVNSGGTESYPIYCDLMKDASPTGKRPFAVLRVIPVKDRWYGFGFYDLLRNDHTAVDDCINRIRARSSASGRLDYLRPDSFQGLEYGATVSLSSGRPYLLKGTTQGPISEHLGSIAFPEMDEKIWQLFEIRRQNAQLLSGTMTAGDSAASGLPSNNTATGQNLLEAESSLTSNDNTQTLIMGMTATLKQAIYAVFNVVDEPAINALLGPEKGKILIEWLKTARPERFAKSVRLLLTKSRGTMALQAATHANQLITGGMSWMQIITTAPWLAKSMQPFFVDSLNATDTANAEDVLTATLKAAEQMMQQQAMAQQAQAAQAAQPAQTATQ